RSFIVLFVLSALGLPTASLAVPSFTAESGTRIAHGSPQAITGSFSSSLRLYFLRDFQILSATSTDGLTWTEETGVRVSSQSANGASVVFSSITAADVLPL